VGVVSGGLAVVLGSVMGDVEVVAGTSPQTASVADELDRATAGRKQPTHDRPVDGAVLDRGAIMSTQGSIRKDDSGAWFFVIDIDDPDGKRRQVKRRGFATKKATQAALTALNGDVQRGTFVAPLRSTLGQFLVDDWLPARSVSLRPSTVVCYGSTPG
jgi:hypothetical protein